MDPDNPVMSFLKSCLDEVNARKRNVSEESVNKQNDSISINGLISKQNTSVHSEVNLENAAKPKEPKSQTFQNNSQSKNEEDKNTTLAKQLEICEEKDSNPNSCARENGTQNRVKSVTAKTFVKVNNIVNNANEVIFVDDDKDLRSEKQVHKKNVLEHKDSTINSVNNFVNNTDKLEEVAKGNINNSIPNIPTIYNSITENNKSSQQHAISDDRKNDVKEMPAKKIHRETSFCSNGMATQTSITSFMKPVTKPPVKENAMPDIIEILDDSDEETNNDLKLLKPGIKRKLTDDTILNKDNNNIIESQNFIPSSSMNNSKFSPPINATSQLTSSLMKKLDPNLLPKQTSVAANNFSGEFIKYINIAPKDSQTCPPKNITPQNVKPKEFKGNTHVVVNNGNITFNIDNLARNNPNVMILNNTDQNLDFHIVQDSSNNSRNTTEPTKVAPPAQGQMIAQPWGFVRTPMATQSTCNTKSVTIQQPAATRTQNVSQASDYSESQTLPQSPTQPVLPTYNNQHIATKAQYNFPQTSMTSQSSNVIQKSLTLLSSMIPQSSYNQTSINAQTAAAMIQMPPLMIIQKPYGQGQISSTSQCNTYNGPTTTYNGQISNNNRQTSISNGQTSMNNGQASMYNGQTTMNNGQATVYNGQTSTNDGQTLNNGPINNSQTYIINGQTSINTPSSTTTQPPKHSHYPSAILLNNKFARIASAENGGKNNQTTNSNGKRFTVIAPKKLVVPLSPNKETNANDEVNNDYKTQVVRHSIKMRYSENSLNKQCDICQTKTTGDFKIRVLPEILPSACPYCSRIFQTRSSLAIHMASHFGNKPFVCQACLKLFLEDKGNPVSKYVYDKLYQCYICKTIKAEKIENVYYNCADPYKCNFCDKAFDKMKVLQQHMNTHIQKFKCDKCEFAHVQRKEIIKQQMYSILEPEEPKAN